MTSPIPQPSADHPNTAGGVDASSVTVGYGPVSYTHLTLPTTPYV